MDIEGRLKSAEEPVPVRVKNLSIGGAFVAAAKLPMGHRVTLWFRVPQLEQEIEAVGVIRWATDQGVGVQFDGLRARETWALGKFFEGLPEAS